MIPCHSKCRHGWQLQCSVCSTLIAMSSSRYLMTRRFQMTEINQVYDLDMSVAQVLVLVVHARHNLGRYLWGSGGRI